MKNIHVGKKGQKGVDAATLANGTGVENSISTMNTTRNSNGTSTRTADTDNDFSTIDNMLQMFQKPEGK